MNLEFLKKKENVVFIGSNGVGKTTLAKNIAHQAYFIALTGFMPGIPPSDRLTFMPLCPTVRQFPRKPFGDFRFHNLRCCRNACIP